MGNRRYSDMPGYYQYDDLDDDEEEDDDDDDLDCECVCDIPREEWDLF